MPFLRRNPLERSLRALLAGFRFPSPRADRAVESIHGAFSAKLYPALKRERDELREVERKYRRLDEMRLRAAERRSATTTNRETGG